MYNSKVHLLLAILGKERNVDAHVEPNEDHFVGDLAASAAELAWFCLVTVVVYVMFVPMFVFGLAVTVRDKFEAVYRHEPASKSELATV